jgi:hypothetical protein
VGTRRHQLTSECTSLPNSTKQDGRIKAFSQLFQRDIIDRRATKLLWVIHNLQDNFQSDDEGKSSQLRSCVVKTQDGACWVLELRAFRQEQFNARLVVHAIETPDDLKNGF